MDDSFVICQISDMHFLDSSERLYNQIHTATQFIKTINFCNKLNPQPDIYIMSGDLIHDKPEYYKKFINISNQLKKPYYLMMGNHDDRSELIKIIKNKKLIDKSGFVNFSLNKFPIKIICLDTAINRTDEGKITTSTMKWLKNELDKNFNKPIIIFMHHPPIDIGSVLMDKIKCLNGNDFLNLTGQYKNILKIVFGHVHCRIEKKIENQELISCPSSSFQFPIDAKSTINIQCSNQGFIQLFKWRKNQHLDISLISISEHINLKEESYQ